MINLQRENRDQINTMKRMKHEHKIEVESLMKKNQVSSGPALPPLNYTQSVHSLVCFGWSLHLNSLFSSCGVCC